MAGSVPQSPGVKKAGRKGNVRLVSVAKAPKSFQLGPKYAAKLKKKGPVMLRGTLGKR